MKPTRGHDGKQRGPDDVQAQLLALVEEAESVTPMLRQEFHSLREALQYEVSRGQEATRLLAETREVLAQTVEQKDAEVGDVRMKLDALSRISATSQHQHQVQEYSSRIAQQEHDSSLGAEIQQLRAALARPVPSQNAC